MVCAVAFIAVETEVKVGQCERIGGAYRGGGTTGDGVRVGGVGPPNGHRGAEARGQSPGWAGSQRP